MTDVDCWVLLVIAGFITVLLIIALVCDHKEQIKDLFQKSEYEKVFEDSWRMPTIDECVKILENDAQACEVLEFIGRNQIKEREKEMDKEMDKEMPSLQFGDVVKWENGSYGIVCKTRIYVLAEMDGLITAKAVSNPKTKTENIVRIYRTEASGFDQHALKAIYNDLGGGYIIWMRPAVKEMTVEQISKELGYTVKVVGSK